MNYNQQQKDRKYKKIDYMNSPACLETIIALIELRQETGNEEQSIQALQTKLKISKTNLSNRLNSMFTPNNKDIIKKDISTHKNRTYKLNYYKIIEVLGLFKKTNDTISTTLSDNVKSKPELQLSLAEYLLTNQYSKEDKEKLQKCGVPLNTINEVIRSLNLHFFFSDYFAKAYKTIKNMNQ